jgi:hypothetical protein
LRYVIVPSAVLAAFLSLSIQANAQGFPPISVSSPPQGQTSSVIGPDGTYYALVPASTSTRQTPVSELVAIAATTTGTTPKWTTDISGEVGQVLPGMNDVYVVQTLISGSGKSTTSTTSILLFPTTSTGAVTGPASTITPTGNISGIEVKTVNGVDYLYIYSVSRTSSTSAGTTTFTTTQTLTIYKNGSKTTTVPIP